MLLIGPAGPERTEILLHLLCAGLSVQGEGQLRVKGRTVTSWPRRLRIRRGRSQRDLPLWDQVRQSPSLPDWQGERVYAFAPSPAGQDWRIDAGTVDHVVVLTENPGGRSGLRAISRHDALGRVLKACEMPRTGRAASVAQLAHILAGAETDELALGVPEQAAQRLTHRIRER
jgi:hypothetical protein